MHLTLIRNILRTFDVRNNLDRVSCLRNSLESKDLHGCSRRSFRDRIAAVREHRANLTVELSCDEWIADVHRSLLDEDRGDRAAALVEFRFEHDARSATCRARLQIQNVSLQQNCL